ncbi:MAG: deoxyribonuclease IV [Candidatus Hodarchaeota archaeon]
MLLGAHVSIAGGFDKAVIRGENIGCDSIQIFTKSQRQWSAKKIDESQVKLFKKALSRSRIKAVVVHTAYLINLASPKKDTLEKSQKAFLEEMDRAETLGIPYLVHHPGAHLDVGEKKGIELIAEGLNISLSARRGYKVMPLLETTAGQGTNLGYKFEELVAIRDLLEEKERVGVCLDTSHIFAAGYDIRTKDAYEKTMETFDEIIGLSLLKAVHLNDSKIDLGKRVDRHEHIGKGKIGLEAFSFLVNDERLKSIPGCLETPGSEEDFKKNLQTLRTLLKK